MNTKENIIKIFDKQIKCEYREANGNKYECKSYWNKLYFDEIYDLTLDDWRIIRSGNYYDVIKEFDSIDKIKYTLKLIKNYKRNINK